MSHSKKVHCILCTRRILMVDKKSCMQYPNVFGCESMQFIQTKFYPNLGKSEASNQQDRLKYIAQCSPRTQQARRSSVFTETRQRLPGTALNGLILFAISMHGPNSWACGAHGSFRRGSGGVAEPEVLVPHRQLEASGYKLG
jgi:hypothetical protein